MGSLFQFSLNSVCWSTFQGRSGKVALPKKRIGEKRVFLGDGVVGSFFQFSLNSVCWFTFQKRSGKVARPKERIGGRYILWGWDHKQLSARLLAATVPPEGQLEDTITPPQRAGAMAVPQICCRRQHASNRE